MFLFLFFTVLTNVSCVVVSIYIIIVDIILLKILRLCYISRDEVKANQEKEIRQLLRTEYFTYHLFPF